MYFTSIRVNQLHRIPGAVDIGTNRWVLVCHRVDGKPHRHQFVVHISGAEVSVACEQVLWTCEPSPAKSPTLRIKAKGVAFFLRWKADEETHTGYMRFCFSVLKLVGSIVYLVVNMYWFQLIY